MPLTQKFTLNDLRTARLEGRKVPVLTCYDFTTARLMQQAGIPVLLVGDSAANVILGHSTTLPVSQGFMEEIAGAVRRGAPLSLLLADMPFGSYHGSLGSATKNVCKMVQRSGCDLVKLEVAAGHAGLVRRLADAGVAVMAHVGLRPQSVGVLGGYRYQGRTADEAEQVVRLAVAMEAAGAVALLLEAVPPEVSAAVVTATGLPVIGCGAGPACHGHVVVTHDAIGLSTHVPRFVPKVGDVSGALVQAFGEYARQVTAGEYPASVHQYQMPQEQRDVFSRRGG